MTPSKRGREFKHGMSSTRVYRLFMNMKSRCDNILWPAYQQYGAKGIQVEWADFESFWQDMGDAYTQHVVEYGERKTTIERINSQGNYSKNNCRWATPAEQNRNTSQNRWISFKGRTQCLTDWAQEIGVKRTTLIMRLDAYGWSITRALTTRDKF